MKCRGTSLQGQLITKLTAFYMTMQQPIQTTEHRMYVIMLFKWHKPLKILCPCIHVLPSSFRDLVQPSEQSTIK